jgi:pyruvate/2-oxoglutarate dehydrogenase complex dihydrolipoamide dehydrogenase (E3) component
LAEAGYLTNETVFSLTELPRRLAVVGAGPIGCELAQAFARFGAAVHLVGNRSQILPREEPRAAARVEKAMVRDGVNLLLNSQVVQVGRQGAEKVVRVERAGQSMELRVDEILVAVGRTPNVQGLGLDAAGVAHDEKAGVHVDGRLRTTNRRIFAAGDVCSRYKFTHAADAMARVVLQNALFPGRARASALIMPWCTYTDPEVAHVGLYEREAGEQGIAVQVVTQEFDEVDRAVLDGDTDGFVRILVRQGTDRIVGATVVARHAGEMISELTLAMVGGLGLKTLARTIHPYPTEAEAIRKAGDSYNRSRLTPLVQALLRRWFAWTR